jgi:hypothetical protein
MENGLGFLLRHKTLSALILKEVGYGFVREEWPENGLLTHRSVVCEDF